MLMILKSLWSVVDGINANDSGTIWAGGCAVLLFGGLWILNHYI